MNILPHAWAQLAASVNGKTIFGMDGVRDPDARCDDFKNGHAGHGQCDTDGHYMCLECAHMSHHAVLSRKCTQRQSCTCELCQEADRL